MLKIQRSFFVAALVLGLAAAPSLAQFAGDLDASFASGGIYALLPDDGELYARAVKVDDAGRIVVVGTAFEPTFAGPIAVRLLPDGTLDPDFGDPADPGVVRVEIPPATVVTPEGEVPVISVEASDFVIDDRGRIVAVGLAQLPGNAEAFAAFRLSANGLLDGTFGDNGLSLFKWGPAQDWLLAVELQRSGNRQNIVAAGLVVDGEGRNRLAVTRLMPDGGLDASFGTGGLFIEDFLGWSSAIARDLLIENNRDIVVVGEGVIGEGVDSDSFVVALRRDGAVDTRFGGGDGWVAVDFSEGNPDNGSGAAFDGRGIVVAGSLLDLTDLAFDLTVLKFTRQGELDDSFGDNGKLRIDLDSPTETAWAVQVQPDGKIVAAGRSTVAGIEAIDIAVVRLLPDGTLDPDFGSNGFVKTDYLDYDEALATALQPDGKIVVAGYGGADGFGFFGATTTADLLVARYLGLASLQTEIGTLQDLVREMAGEGMIQRRRARSLISKLDLAIYFLERNGEPVALQFLRLFRVETMLATAFGQIQPAAGAELIEQIDVLIAALRSR